MEASHMKYAMEIGYSASGVKRISTKKMKKNMEKAARSGHGYN